ncbi:Transcriptional regulator NanR [Lentibacillus sp. JNUCC-1]|uniref:GntR family transcriptional regulator n=1 Tax=Lentibacillus sp. JNUCC-1 TaxID=2654513 RepID=UPI001325B3D9|nr:GntR family transcriptional regulator [Lentibacillus sp. JNUCC-1]MUV37097.1 Transcriptional regulator NanR [Lentibacillus sp. JNUCC-1]
MAKEQRKIPLYVQIKGKLMARIKNQEWMPGDPLPSEGDLMQQFNVSRTTIRQAIRDLTQEGIIETRRGAVARIKTTPNDKMENPGIVHHELGTDFSAKVLRSQYVSDHYYAQHQLKQENKSIYFLERVRLADDVPIGIQQLYTPAKIGHLIEEKAASWFDIFPLLGMNGVTYSNIKEDVTASLVNQHEADLLGISCGDPLIGINRVTLGTDRQPIEFSKTKYLPEHFNYRIEIGYE